MKQNVRLSSIFVSGRPSDRPRRIAKLSEYRFRPEMNAKCILFISQLPYTPLSEPFILSKWPIPSNPWFFMRGMHLLYISNDWVKLHTQKWPVAAIIHNVHFPCIMFSKKRPFRTFSRIKGSERHILENSDMHNYVFWWIFLLQSMQAKISFTYLLIALS